VAARADLRGDLDGVDEDALQRVRGSTQGLIGDGPEGLLHGAVPRGAHPLLGRDERLAGAGHVVEPFDEALAGQVREDVTRGASGQGAASRQALVGRVGEGEHMVRSRQQGDAGGDMREHLAQTRALVRDGAFQPPPLRHVAHAQDGSDDRAGRIAQGGAAHADRDLTPIQGLDPHFQRRRQFLARQDARERPRRGREGPAVGVARREEVGPLPQGAREGVGPGVEPAEGAQRGVGAQEAPVGVEGRHAIGQGREGRVELGRLRRHLPLQPPPLGDVAHGQHAANRAPLRVADGRPAHADRARAPVGRAHAQVRDVRAGQHVAPQHMAERGPLRWQGLAVGVARGQQGVPRVDEPDGVGGVVVTRQDGAERGVGVAHPLVAVEDNHAIGHGLNGRAEARGLLRRAVRAVVRVVPGAHDAAGQGGQGDADRAVEAKGDATPQGGLLDVKHGREEHAGQEGRARERPEEARPHPPG
jgi:hypothetical protein